MIFLSSVCLISVVWESLFSAKVLSYWKHSKRVVSTPRLCFRACMNFSQVRKTSERKITFLTWERFQFLFVNSSICSFNPSSMHGNFESMWLFKWVLLLLRWLNVFPHFVVLQSGSFHALSDHLAGYKICCTLHIGRARSLSWNEFSRGFSVDCLFWKTTRSSSTVSPFSRNGQGRASLAIFSPGQMVNFRLKHVDISWNCDSGG